MSYFTGGRGTLIQCAHLLSDSYCCCNVREIVGRGLKDLLLARAFVLDDVIKATTQVLPFHTRTHT